MACSCAREPCGSGNGELVAPYHFELRSLCFKRHRLRYPSILTWYKGNRDQQGIHNIEDLKVLGRLPDLFNSVKIGQGQLQLIIKHILFYNI